MREPTNNYKSMGFTAFQILWKVTLLALQVVAMFASNRRSNSRYLPYQAQDLYRKGLISAAEYNKAIKG